MKTTLDAAAAVACVMLVAGCAASTGVIATGADTYSVSHRDNGPMASLGAIKAKAYQDAAGFCAGKGRSPEIIKTLDVPRSLGQFPEVELIFRCGESESRR